MGLGSTEETPPTPNPITPNRRLSAWHTCFSGQLAVLTDPKALHASAAAVAAAAETLTAAGDAAGEAKAHQVHADALSRLGQVGASEAALERGAGRGAAGGVVGTEPRDPRERPLSRRRARAAHHPGRPRRRGRGAALPGRARGAAGAHRGGAAHDRLLAAHGR